MRGMDAYVLLMLSEPISLSSVKFELQEESGDDKWFVSMQDTPTA